MYSFFPQWANIIKLEDCTQKSRLEAYLPKSQPARYNSGGQYWLAIHSSPHVRGRQHLVHHCLPPIPCIWPTPGILITRKQLPRYSSLLPPCQYSLSPVSIPPTSTPLRSPMMGWKWWLRLSRAWGGKESIYPAGGMLGTAWLTQLCPGARGSTSREPCNRWDWQCLPIFWEPHRAFQHQTQLKCCYLKEKVEHACLKHHCTVCGSWHYLEAHVEIKNNSHSW